MKHAESTFQAEDGLRLYFQAWQPDGAARACLAIVHGIGEHSSRYRNVVEYVVPRGYAVYSFDLRGHGKSEGKRGYVNSWEEYRRDVKTFLEKVRKEQSCRRLFLMGHSLGGLIVLNYLLHYPEKLDGVVASAPALAQTGTSPLLMTLARILSSIAPTLTMKTGLDVAAISRDPAVVEAYKNDPLVHGLATPRLGAEMDATMTWTRAHAADFTLPVLVLHGEADSIVPFTASRDFYEKAASKDKEYISYPGGYHESHNDIHKAQALEDVTRWLNARSK